MEYEAQNLGKVEGLGTIYRVDAPLDKQIEAFKKVGITAPCIATPEQIAQIRLAGITDNWSRTSVAPIAIKGGKTILVRESPLMNPLMATTAVALHRNGQYLTIDNKVYEEAEQTAKSETGILPEDRKAIVVSQEGDFGLTCETDEIKFLLGKHNTSYFERFVNGGKKGKIQFYNLSGESKDKATVNYLWFDNPQSGSVLLVRGRSLDDDGGAFAVLRNPAEGSAQKSKLEKTIL